MENLEYLEKVKNDNLDYLTYKLIGEHEIEYRKARALEIIAETLINNNSTLRTLINVLEDIETTLKQR